MWNTAITPRDYVNPDWNNKEKVHDWKNYISPEIQENWDKISRTLKAMIARQADAMAGLEEWD